MPEIPEFITNRPRARPAGSRSEQIAAMTSALRSHGQFHCDTHLGDDVTLRLPPLPGTIMFHLVMAGRCVVACDDRSVTVGPGTVVLVPHGRGHTIGTAGVDGAVGDAAGLTVSLEESGLIDLGGGIERLDLHRPGGTEELAHVVCGALTLEHPAAPTLPRALAPLIVVSPEGGTEQERVRVLTGLIQEEVAAHEPGWALICRRLTDALAVRAVRRAVSAAPTEAGWWAATNDRRLAPVLAAVHAAPERGWTLALLAAEAGMSRSAFAQLFSTVTGEAPLAWVGRQRMALAHRLLSHGHPVSAVARRTGYGSEVSFRRAFRRITGTTPGAVRTGTA